MDIQIAMYRSRIGNFSTSNHLSYIPDRTKKTYKSRTETVYNFRRFTLFMILVLIISKLSRFNIGSQKVPQHPNINPFGTIAEATDPVSFFILGGQASVSFPPSLHLDHHGVGVHSAATNTMLQGAQAGDLDIGWIVVALPL